MGMNISSLYIYLLLHYMKKNRILIAKNNISQISYIAKAITEHTTILLQYFRNTLTEDLLKTSANTYYHQ